MDPDIKIQDEPCHLDEIVKTDCYDYNELGPYANDSEKGAYPLYLSNSEFSHFVSLNKYKVSNKPMKYELQSPIAVQGKYYNKSHLLSLNKYKVSTKPMKYDLQSPIAVRGKYYNKSGRKEKPNSGQEKEQISVYNDNVISTQIEKTDAINGNLYYYSSNYTCGKTKRWSCKICNNSFVKLMLFIEHWNSTHKEDTLIMCMKGALTHPNKLNFIKIKETDIERTNTNSNRITDNNSTTASNKNLDVKIEEKYKCPLCSNSFSVLHDMIKHIDTHKDSKKFSCSVCNIYLKTESALNNHMKDHENPVKKRKAHQTKDCRFWKCQSYSKREFDECDPINELSFSCSLCTVTFVETMTFIEHLKNVHKLEDPISCPICDEDFKGQSYGALAIHMWDHSDHSSGTAVVSKRNKFIKYIDSNNKVSQYSRYEQYHRKGKDEINYIKMLKNWKEKQEKL